jgi:hypothetical protein
VNRLIKKTVYIFLRKWGKIKIVLKKGGAFFYLLSLSIIIDIDIYRSDFDTL